MLVLKFTDEQRTMRKWTTKIFRPVITDTIVLNETFFCTDVTKFDDWFATITSKIFLKVSDNVLRVQHLGLFYAVVKFVKRFN